MEILRVRTRDTCFAYHRALVELRFGTDLHDALTAFHRVALPTSLLVISKSLVD